MSKERENNEEIQIRSDEVQEILSHVPNWMIRWGITLIFVLILLFFFCAWLIKYPDVVQGSATLTTKNPPIKLVVKANGEIQNINYPKKAFVQKGASIATVKSTLTPEAKIFLKKEIDTIKEVYKNKRLSTFNLSKTDFVFGEIQTNYVSLTTAIENLQYLINKGSLSFNLQNLQEQIQHQQEMEAIIFLQIKQTKTTVQNAKNKFQSDKILYKKGVISRSDFYERQKSYQNSVSSLNNLKKNRISTEITISNLKKQLNDTQFEFDKKKTDLLQEIDNQISKIENELASWKKTYVLSAPISGKLTYLQTIDENQSVKQGEVLFAIVPQNESYVAQLKIAKTGYGKVKVGQKVILKLDNYPFKEYGEIIGKVASVSLIPNKKGYLVQAVLTNGLTTTYGKKIKYTPEMSGTAQIITEDLRITDRIFNQFRQILSR